jgi:integrase
MTAVDSTLEPVRSKPAKPYPEFPLFAHAAGVWAKKIRGKLHYFGPWSDPDGALKKYLAEKDALHTGRKPRADPNEPTVKDLANAFLIHKRHLADNREITMRTWQDYKDTCDRLVKTFGKGRLVADLDPEDFAKLRAGIARRWGPIRLGNEIQRVRSAFKYGFDAGLLDRPMSFGPGFQRPSKKVLRLERAKKGPRMFEAEEVRRILDAAGTPFRAMVLLGLNGAFGNADCATLPLKAVDLETGWIDYPRPKTGILRRFPLWPETVEALKAALARRKEPKDPGDSGLFFITKFATSWSKTASGRNHANPVSWEMKKLLQKLGIDGHRNFYALRHTFETIAGESRDQAAVDHVMGHARDDMASVYRERISDQRLRAVTDHVRAWLFPAEPRYRGAE